jgi:hypothetical protein
LIPPTLPLLGHFTLPLNVFFNSLAFLFRYPCLSLYALMPGFFALPYLSFYAPLPVFYAPLACLITSPCLSFYFLACISCIHLPVLLVPVFCTLLVFLHPLFACFFLFLACHFTTLACLSRPLPFLFTPPCLLGLNPLACHFMPLV